MLICLSAYLQFEITRQCKLIRFIIEIAPDQLPTSCFSICLWWRRTGLNRRPPACKAGALPLSYAPVPHASHGNTEFYLVGPGRFELPTSRLSSARSNQLSYEPGLVLFLKGMRRRRHLQICSAHIYQNNVSNVLLADQTTCLIILASTAQNSV